MYCSKVFTGGCYNSIVSLEERWKTSRRGSCSQEVSLVRTSIPPELLEVGQNWPVMSYHANRPILIRYIDPRLVPIFKELNSITSQCQLIAQEATLPTPTPQQHRIEQLLQSTKKISDQFHSIIDDSQQIATEPFQTDPAPSTLESEGQKQCSQKDETQKQEEEECLNAIDVVNRTSLRLQELEEQNEGLRGQLEREKKRADEAELESKELRQRLNRFEKDKKEMVTNIRLELERLKDDNLIVTTTSNLE